jgi:hypothetical protein
MSPSEDGSNPPIEQVQFAIRVDEHLRTIADLVNRAIRSAGYSSDAEQGDDGRELTATEYSGKAQRSLSTRRKKLRYWQRIEPLLESLLKIDAEYFGSNVVPLPVRMEVPAIAQPTLAELAQTAALLKQAEAASLRTRVALLHPDWDPSQIDAEVDLIQSEGSVIDPLTFGLGGAGVTPPAGSSEPDTNGATDDATV